MKLFTDSDVETPGGAMYPRIFLADHRAELVHAPLAWQKQGLQQTASGYGPKLTSPYKINFNGKLYRVYITHFSNAGSSWFKAQGRKIYVN